MLATLGSERKEVAERLISDPEIFTNGRKAPIPRGKSELTIRLARGDDAAQIVQLMRIVFRGKELLSRPGFVSAGDVEQLMTQGKFLLAENETGIIGCAYLELRLEASRLDLLAVAPSQQRAGIGSQLLEAAERLSSSMQCLFMHLRVVNLHWETIKFCRRRGYVEFALESLNGDQPVSLHCHIVRMCKKLKADCLAF